MDFLNQTEEEKYKSNLTPEDRKRIYDYLLNKVDFKDSSAASDAAADKSNLVINIARAVEGLGRAKSVSRGGPGVNDAFYSSLQSQVDKKRDRQREQDQNQAHGQVFPQGHFGGGG